MPSPPVTASASPRGGIGASAANGRALAIAPIREAPVTFLIVGILGFGLILLLTWTAFWLAGQVVVRVPMYQYVPATVFWRGVSLAPYLVLDVLSGVAVSQRAMTGALAVCAAMTVHMAVINPMLLVARLSPERVPGALEYMGRTLPGFSMYGLAMLAATAAGITLRQRRAAHRASNAISTSSS